MGASDQSYVTTERFTDHLSKCDRIQDGLEETQKNLEGFKVETMKALDSKVGYSHFYWVIGAYVVVIGGILTFSINLSLRIDDKLTKNVEQTSSVESSVSNINGQLKFLKVID